MHSGDRWLTDCFDQRPPDLDTSCYLAALLSHPVLGSPSSRSASGRCRRYSSTHLYFPGSSISVTAGKKSRLQDLGLGHAEKLLILAAYCACTPRALPYWFTLPARRKRMWRISSWRTAWPVPCKKKNSLKY